MTSPLSDDELGPLFDTLLCDPAGRPLQVTLAVSGGPDSMALMLAVARWRDAGRVPGDVVDVLTIDHRLRPDAAAEAAMVAEAARRLNFAATIRVWASPTRAGLQEQARAARLALFAEHVAGRGGAGIVTAHTRDDQAETLVMRLARGSGLDGLAAMTPRTNIDGLLVLRPLLDVSKDRLQATVRAAGLSAVNDPSNRDAAFERVRLRAARPALAALGLTDEALARTAARLADVRGALDWQVGAMLERPDLLTISPLGYAEVDRKALAAYPAALRTRLLASLLDTVGGRRPLPLAAAEALEQATRSDTMPRRTLAGCLVAIRRGRVMIVREPGRQHVEPVHLAAGAEAVFDRRFRIRLGPEAPDFLMLAPAGPEGVRLARVQGLVDGDVPAAVLRTLPALVAPGICALPALGDPLSRSWSTTCILIRPRPGGVASAGLDEPV